MPVTFPVSDVGGPSRIKEALPRETSLAKLLGCASRARRLEALSHSNARLVAATDAHALAQAAHDAFYDHHPLTLSPDAVWFCLAQGFAHHVALNAELLRDRFVKHQGKVKLVVERPDFILGQPNPWPEAFAAFSDQIAAHVGKRRDLVVADFSTTGPVERAASEIVLMDAFQAYFEYEMMCGCGIPEITLLGTPDDWASIRRRAAVLSEFGLEWWTRALTPVLDEIVRTAEGHIDRGFWQSFFRYKSGSGPSELTGWINVLFPYIKTSPESDELGPSPYVATWESALRTPKPRTSMFDPPNGTWLGALPGSIASAPVKLTDLRDGSEHNLRFVAGLFGVVENPATRALAPEFGWAVVEEPPSSLP